MKISASKCWSECTFEEANQVITSVLKDFMPFSEEVISRFSTKLLDDYYRTHPLNESDYNNIFPEGDSPKAGILYQDGSLIIKNLKENEYLTIRNTGSSWFVLWNKF